jgi:DNA-binding transcriptional ArsR family regulator
MSHYMTALAMKQSGLKPATKIVLYWLADCHNQETGKCFPSINHLASVCEMSRRSVEGHLSILEELGLIKRFNQFRDRGGKTSNSYVLELMGTSEHNSSTESDTQNLRMVCEKSAQGHTQNLRMNNLGINNLGKETNISSSDDDGVDYYFDQLWEEYPRKVGKAQAKKAFKTASKKINFYDLLPKFEAYVLTLEGKETQFIPHLATWLNGERWKDEGQ